MFYRQKTKKLRKRKNLKVKESLEILKVSVYPIFDNKEKFKSRKKKILTKEIVKSIFMKKLNVILIHVIMCGI